MESAHAMIVQLKNVKLRAANAEPNFGKTANYLDKIGEMGRKCPEISACLQDELPENTSSRHS
jgi:hypothetical protein